MAGIILIWQFIISVTLNQWHQALCSLVGKVKNRRGLRSCSCPTLISSILFPYLPSPASLTIPVTLVRCWWVAKDSAVNGLKCSSSQRVYSFISRRKPLWVQRLKVKIADNRVLFGPITTWRWQGNYYSPPFCRGVNGDSWRLSDLPRPISGRTSIETLNIRWCPLVYLLQAWGACPHSSSFHSTNSQNSLGFTFREIMHHSTTS